MGELSDLGRELQRVVTEPAHGIGPIVEKWFWESVELLKQEAPKGSGALANSFLPEFDFSQGITHVTMYANAYWDFINSGVDGVERGGIAKTNSEGKTYSFKDLSVGSSMLNSLSGGGGLGWIASKGLQADDYESLAWAIAKSVKKKGIMPTQYMEKVFSEQRLQELDNRILDFIQKKI